MSSTRPRRSLFLGCTKSTCPSQTHELLGIGWPESARPELGQTCVDSTQVSPSSGRALSGRPISNGSCVWLGRAVENVAAKLLGVNSLADVSHLPVMEFRAILHLILHWFLFYHFFQISSHFFPFFSILFSPFFSFPFFSILFHSVPSFPIVSHSFRFFSHFCHSFY